VAGWQDPILSKLDATQPVLIAGPTASGKSGLALRIAETQGGVIVNADALQVYADWSILTARPGPEELARAPHALYGHMAGDRAYSVGDWLRDVAPILGGPARPILVGGTGLYFTALTEGLAEIPLTPQRIRAEADRRLAEVGPAALLAELDAETANRIDRNNPVRIQRAWEVLATTGRGLASWQRDTGAPLLLRDQAQAIVLSADRNWLARRIERRFDEMLDAGLMDEARRNRPLLSAHRPSSKAIGTAELMAFLDGDLSEESLCDKVVTLTRQYAKRQRSWFRARMRDWDWYSCH